jgi:acetyl-CoA carboxylase carboxyl transferase subunit alpha
MRITAQDLMDLGVIDEIIAEPVGGAHRDKTETIERTGAAIHRALESLEVLSADELRHQRAERFMQMGRGL